MSGPENSPLGEKQIPIKHDPDMDDLIGDSLKSVDASKEIPKPAEEKPRTDKEEIEHLLEITNKKGEKKIQPNIEKQAPEESEAFATRQKTISKLQKESEAASRAASFVVPEEERKVRIDSKQKSIRQEESIIRKKAAESAIATDNADAPDKKKEKEKQRENLENDLQKVDMANFYKQYCALLRLPEQERARELLQLQRTLQTSLNDGAKARGAAEAEPYDDVAANKIFAALTTAEQVESYAYVLYQKRLLIVLEIDEQSNTKLSDRVRDILANNALQPHEKLEEIDKLLHKIAHLHLKDINLQKMLAELNIINTLQDAADSAIQMLKTEAGILFTAVVGAFVIGEISSHTENVPAADEPFINEQIAAGRGDLVKKMLEKKPLEKQPDGSYKGTIEGEDVYLAKRDGRLVAYLKEGSDEISIPLTTPNAVGFDLACGEKTMQHIGCTDVVQQEDLRWEMLDAPGDEEFMDREHEKQFHDLLRLILGREPGEAKSKLFRLGLLDDRGMLRQDCARALKKTLLLWSKQYGTLEGLEHTDRRPAIRKLIQTWDAEKLKNGTPSFRPYALEDIQSDEKRR